MKAYGGALRSGRPWLSLGIGVFILLLASCLPSQWSYLNEATDRATQEEVKDRFGAPVETKSLEDEGSLWVYRYEVKGGWLIGRRGDMVGGAPCMEYRLTFDSRKVLRYWTRQPCGMDNPKNLGYHEDILVRERGRPFIASAAAR